MLHVLPRCFIHNSYLISVYKIRLVHKNFVFSTPTVTEIPYFVNKILTFIPFRHEPGHNFFKNIRNRTGIAQSV